MKRNFNTILLIFFVFFGCKTYDKSLLYSGLGGVELARKNVIIDFINTYRTPNYYLKKRDYKPFNVFSFVRSRILNENLYLLSVLPNDESIAVSIEDKIGKIPRKYFPNNYFEKEGKLFLWNDGSTPLRKDVLDVMSNYGVLDSTDVKIELGLLPDDFDDTRMIKIDDRLESYNYFICRNDISMFKKVLTHKAFGYYKRPKINCSGGNSTD